VTRFPTPLEQQYGTGQSDLRRRLEVLERQIAQLTSGPVAVTSTTHPATPWAGMQIYETDTGLSAQWTGTAWQYPPQLITKRVLNASAASLTLSGIPQVFTHLQLVVSAKSDGTSVAGFDAANLQLNGVATASYQWSTIWVTQGGAVSTTGATAQTSSQFAEVWNAHFGTQGRGIVTVEIPNYSDVNNVKGFTSSVSASDGGTAGITQFYTGALGSGSTAAVTSIKLLMGVGNFVADSTFSLYGR
jgi:hypothetical protein